MTRIARPPIPHEHGAWMMLYAPLLTGLVVYPVAWLPAALLVMAATGAFFAQNAAGLLLRRRGTKGVVAWLTAYSGLGGASVAVLTLAYGLWSLVPLGAPGVGLFAWQAYRRRATRRQIDRSTGNELATVAVLALGASAARVAATGGVDAGAILPWSVFALYFIGSVFYVKMRVDAARLRGTDPWVRRWRVGRVCTAYHLGVVGLVAAASARGWPSVEAAAWAALAYAPAVLRALGAWVSLGGGGAPPLRRIGVCEVAYAMWFSVWIGVAVHSI